MKKIWHLVSNTQRCSLQYVQNGVLSQEDYETYKAYDIKQDLPAESVDVTSRGWSLLNGLDEATNFMYDYLYKRQRLLPKN